MLMYSVSVRKPGLASAIALSMICGFTATMTIPAPATASRFWVVTLMPP